MEPVLLWEKAGTLHCADLLQGVWWLCETFPVAQWGLSSGTLGFAELPAQGLLCSASSLLTVSMECPWMSLSWGKCSKRPPGGGELQDGVAPGPRDGAILRRAHRLQLAL